MAPLNRLSWDVAPRGSSHFVIVDERISILEQERIAQRQQIEAQQRLLHEYNNSLTTMQNEFKVTSYMNY